MSGTLWVVPTDPLQLFLVEVVVLLFLFLFEPAPSVPLAVGGLHQGVWESGHNAGKKQDTLNRVTTPDVEIETCVLLIAVHLPTKYKNYLLKQGKGSRIKHT